MFANEVLYNCMPDCAAPDWNQFDAIEIGGCKNVSDSADETCIEGGQKANEAEFFCVYGHLKEGGVEAITDCQTLELAHSVAEQFAAQTGFEIFDHT